MWIKKNKTPDRLKVNEIFVWYQKEKDKYLMLLSHKKNYSLKLDKKINKKSTTLNQILKKQTVD